MTNFLQAKESPFKGYAIQPKQFFDLLKEFHIDIYNEYLDEALNCILKERDLRNEDNC